MKKRLGVMSVFSMTLALVLGISACSQSGGDRSADRLPGINIKTGDEDKFASLVLRGGKVVTVDESIGDSQAIAMRGHRILAVGSNQDISKHIGAQTHVIELAGRMVMPGFIEGHGHFLYLGRTKQLLDFSAANNWDDIVTMVAEAAKRAAPGDWIQGFGWHQDKWDRLPKDAISGMPQNGRLNQVAPNNPVYLTHASAHAAIANIIALAAGGITDQLDNPAGGTIVRTPQGNASGMLLETAQYSVAQALSDWESARGAKVQESILRERAQLAAAEALSHGVTSFHDAGTSFAEIDFLKMLELENQLPVRLYVMVSSKDNDFLDEKLPDYLMLPQENDFLVVRSIKGMVDGALGSRGAWLLDHYEGLPNTTGLVVQSVKELERVAKAALKYGFQLNTHAIGDRGNREVLDLYQRTFATHNVEGSSQRWRIEHAQHLNPADVPRFSELGIIASMQGVHATSDGPWVTSRLGQERTASTSYVWRDLLDAGVIINNGTDTPVESIDPIASFYSSVSRITANGDRFTADQTMSRREALESYTINNAYAAFEEDIKGSLTPGKLADMVVLSQDIMAIPEQEIPKTRVEITIVGGEIRYQRESLADRQ